MPEKWQAGDPIRDIIEIEGIRAFWYKGRHYAPGMVLSWSYRRLNDLIQSKQLLTAVRTCPYQPDGCIHGDRPICEALNAKPSVLHCKHEPLTGGGKPYDWSRYGGQS